MEQSMSALLPSKEIYEALGEMCVRFQDVETALKWLGVSLRGPITQIKRIQSIT